MEKLKVLILDDNDLHRAKTQQIFSSCEDYEIISSTNDGLEGYNLVCDKKPDIILSDIVLQNYDGFELLEKIKQMEGNVKPKVLIMSSLKGDDFAQKAIDLGASYYMVKPVVDEVLLKRIKALTTVSLEEIKRPVSIKTPKNRALEEKISNVFITVGIPAHIKGYQFLREAIKMAIEEPDIINSITKQLYP